MFGLLVLSIAFQFNWKILVFTLVGLAVYVGMYVGVAEGYAQLSMAVAARQASMTTAPGASALTVTGTSVPMTATNVPMTGAAMNGTSLQVGVVGSCMLRCLFL